MRRRRQLLHDNHDFKFVIQAPRRMKRMKPPNCGPPLVVSAESAGEPSLLLAAG
jgi:hypothetical protein